MLGVPLIINKITRVDCDKCLAVNKICRHSGQAHCCMLSGHTRNWLCPIAFDGSSKLDQWSGVLLLRLVNPHTELGTHLRSLLFQKTRLFPRSIDFLASALLTYMCSQVVCLQTDLKGRAP